MRSLLLRLLIQLPFQVAAKTQDHAHECPEAAVCPELDTPAVELAQADLDRERGRGQLCVPHFLTLGECGLLSMRQLLHLLQQKVVNLTCCRVRGQLKVKTQLVQVLAKPVQ